MCTDMWLKDHLLPSYSEKSGSLEGHFVHITFSKTHVQAALFPSMLSFAMEIFSFSVKKQTFFHSGGIMNTAWHNEYAGPLFAEYGAGLVSCEGLPQTMRE